ncbi:MAG TPA: alpha/beta fold hydrolase [Acidimicrobiales bacterium]|nr:alpha/beta fold hydrolase [Acidimicrobiales bacterium]
MTLPPVVLAHGFAGSARTTWTDAGWLDLLADEGRRAVAVDLLGHGEAPKPHEPEAYGDLAGYLADLLPDEPVDGIGFSLGAATLLQTAIAEPGRFRRLVLAGIGDDLFAPPDASPVADLIEHGGELPESPFIRHLADLASSPGTDKAAFVACLRRPRTPLDEEQLARVQLPVLLVIGERDHVIPPDRLAAGLPDSRVQVLRGVDHSRTPSAMGFLDAALGFIAG